MLKIGLVGFGFLGQMHARNWLKQDGAVLAAVCDIDEDKLKNAGGTAGNLGDGAEPLDLTGVELFTDFDKMIDAIEFDAATIALPTFLHAEYTVKALNAGHHVFCEKPMALNVEQCTQMIDAAEKTGKVLQVGHCIRFWPEYIRLKEIIDSGQYGRLRQATLQRLSATPTWSWKGWILDDKLSGSAILDLHIHDSDIVRYLFGTPKSVFSRATRTAAGALDHVVTQYIYDNDKSVTAEGGWMMGEGFGFEMRFHAIFEDATVVFDLTRDPAFKICPTTGPAIVPEVPQHDAYAAELAYFVDTITGKNPPEVLTPRDSRASVELVHAERESALKGKLIDL